MDFTKQIRKLERILTEGRTPDILSKRIAAYEKRYGSEVHDDGKLFKSFLDNEFYVKPAPGRHFAQGTQQLMFNLDVEHVVKAANFLRLEGYYIVHLAPHYTRLQQDMIEFLNEQLDLSIEAVILSARKFNDNSRLIVDDHGTFMITEDLSKGGLYEVRDIKKDEDFSSFTNGKIVKEKFLHYQNILLDLFNQYSAKGKEWEVEINRHNEKGTPNQAFRKVFFLQIKPDNTASIVPGDFDHVTFYKPHVQSFL